MRGLLVLTALITLISVDDEIEIGRQADAKVRKEMAAFDDAETAAYVRGLAQRLVRVAPGPRYPYRFSVANYREINAFALPGGPVWINRGVLHAATNESQVAGVLAHEIAHIAQRHAADQLTKAMFANFSLGALGALLGNTGGASAAQSAAGLATNIWFLKFSRDDESEADRVGLRILTRAGWDGRGMVELFQIIDRAGGGDAVAWLSSHPTPKNRITALQADVGRTKGGTRDSAKFRAVKARLLKMAPAKPMPTR
jgi:beta-barrel assembly-enhancing protease